MSKELFVSSTPHETKVAIVEEDQLAEVYFERENEYTLAGSIYKGRVTRVLPGMQSAFVNIGLERDAFLYVSDFLLDEDEDADVLEQVVARGPVVIEVPDVAQEAQQNPIEAQEVMLPIESNEGEASTASEVATEGAPGGDGEREGARKWRGRRRRGRGRERFHDRDDRSGREQHEQRPVETAAPALEARTEAPASHQATHQAMVLPGESISKYQPHSATPTQARTQPKPPGQSGVKPSTEYSIDPSKFSPGSMVLPGESLAKYRNERGTPSAAASVEAHPPLEHSQISVEPGEVVSQHEASAEEHHTPAAAVDEIKDLEQTGHPETPSKVVDEQERQRLDNMNVASVFGGAQVEMAEATEASDFIPPAEQSRDVSEPAAQASTSWDGPEAARGVVEEEEIEEEESEMPQFDDEDRLELSDFEELEEEELAPVDDQMVAMGRELTEAVRDAHVVGHATGQYEAEGLEGSETDEDLAESAEDDSANGDAEGEEADEEAAIGAEGEGENGERRAEVRAPGATAGYQQRTGRTPDRRNRRFGRRMRGRPRHNVQRQLPAISDLLKEGQEILVQIAKEPIAKKGARITSHIALPGRYLVYMPTVHHTGVSRKIASEEERHRLKRIVLSERGEAHGGFIVRTAAAGANEDDLRADIRFLINLWSEIRGRAEKSKAPALIYHDLNLVERILRDQVTVSFSSIMVDSEQEYERILRFVSRFQSSLVKRVKLYTKDTPLFEQFNISEEINKALKSKVWLKSGGYIVINQTEALVAIDVNTGKYVGKTARLEDTIVKTNIDAIREIVRQIRLRDLGGIIVIDFIDMDERKNRQRVMQALEEALKADRAPSKVLQFNDFGLVAITRKRVKQSLERTLGQQCPICTGTGMIKSVTTTCNEIYVEMRKMARHFERDIMLRVHPEVAKVLKTNGARWLQEMEELTKQTVLVKSDPLLHPEQFDIQ
ncbi:MAG TPA: Rne/Rng family ribonuclease [Candidatus Angelobacter sp.]